MVYDGLRLGLESTKTRLCPSLHSQNNIFTMAGRRVDYFQYSTGTFDDDDDEKYLFGPLIFTEVNSKRRPAVAKLLHTA